MAGPHSLETLNKILPGISPASGAGCPSLVFPGSVTSLQSLLSCHMSFSCVCLSLSFPLKWHGIRFRITLNPAWRSLILEVFNTQSYYMYANLKVILLSERNQIQKVFTESFIYINFKNRQNLVLVIAMKTLVFCVSMRIVWKQT